MPEAPEVQIIVDHLNKLKNWKLTNVWILEKKWLGKRKKLENLIGSELTAIDRRGKYIIFTFNKNNESFYIINHLAISGNWLFRNNAESKGSIYTRLSFTFIKGNEKIIIDFVDAKKFGRLNLYNSAEFWSEKIQSKLSKLGLDVFETITFETLNQRIHDFTEEKPNWEIKPLLMEQSFLAGIGNIYASEICFLAGINPYKKASLLTQNEITQLYEAIPVVIKTAYENNGSTIKIQSSQRIERMVYGLKYCRLCKSLISKGPQNGRTTYWCPKCQQL